MEGADAVHGARCPPSGRFVILPQPELRWQLLAVQGSHDSLMLHVSIVIFSFLKMLKQMSVHLAIAPNSLYRGHVNVAECAPTRPIPANCTGLVPANCTLTLRQEPVAREALQVMALTRVATRQNFQKACPLHVWAAAVLLGRGMGWAAGRFPSTKHAFPSVVLTPGMGASSQQTPVGVCGIEGQPLLETMCHCRRASWDPDQVAALHGDASLLTFSMRRVCRVTQGHLQHSSFLSQRKPERTGHHNASYKRADSAWWCPHTGWC